MDRPRIVTLCGSSKFQKQHEEAQKQETLLGKIVIPMGMYGHHEGLDMDGPVKRMLDELHLRKIDISTEIFIVNPGGYVGDSTFREICYACDHGKGVLVWEDSFSGPHKDELCGLFRHLFRVLPGWRMGKNIKNGQ